MYRKLVLLGIVAAFVTTFIGFVQPTAAAGTCTTISGSYSGSTTLFTSASFALKKDDHVFASNSYSNSSAKGVGVIIVIGGAHNAFHSAGSFAAGQATATTTTTGYVQFINDSRPGETLNWSLSYGATCGQTTLTFTDGRVNSHDAVESAAIYCEGDNSVTVWIVVNSVGYFDFTATTKEINKVPVQPAKNTLIKSGMGIALYRLTTGELQVNAPNNYVFIWKGCPPE